MTALVILPGLDGTGRLLDAFCARLGRSGIAAEAMVYPTEAPLGYAALEAHVRAQIAARSPSALRYRRIGALRCSPAARSGMMAAMPPRAARRRECACVRSAAPPNPPHLQSLPLRRLRVWRWR
jgi:hypothetical protein